MSRMTKENVCLAAILGAAFALRAAGAHFGLPAVYHADEPAVVNHAMSLGARGFNPHYFVLPGFTMYYLFFLYSLFYALGHVAGWFASTGDFALAFFKSPTPFYVIGRIAIGATFGTATVALVYKMGRDFFSERIGLIAAFFLAFAYGPVVHGHYIYPDVPLTFALTAFFYSVFQLLRVPRIRNYVLAGAFLGWAVGIKYTAAYFLPVAIAAHFKVFRTRPWGAEAVTRLVRGALAALGAFALVAPFTFLDWGSFLAQIHGQTSQEKILPVFHHLFYSLANLLGAPLLALGLFGFLPLTRRSKEIAAFIGGGCALYYVISVFFSQPFTRYMMPLAPLLCLSAAFGAEWLWLHLAGRRIFRGVLTGLFMIAIAVPVLYADALFMRTDTRDEALAWVRSSVPAGSVVALDSRFFSPPLVTSGESLDSLESAVPAEDDARRKRLEFMRRAAKKRKSYRTLTLLQEGQDPLNPTLFFQGPFAFADAKALEREGVHFLILNGTHPNSRAETLKSEWSGGLKLVRTFTPYRDGARTAPVDPFSATAAPDSTEELFARHQLGPYLEIYEVVR